MLSVSQNWRDHRRLEEIFQHSNWLIREAASCRQAIDGLANEQSSVVICDSAMPDGGWRWLLQRTLFLPVPPVMVIACRHEDDDLWADILNEGAYDVLAKPFDQTEVIRIVSLAWLYWKDRMDAKRGHANVA